MNYAVGTIKGYKLIWQPDQHWGRKYRLQLPDGGWEGQLENGRWFRTMALTTALDKYPKYATDLIEAWKLLVEMPYHVRQELLHHQWDADNPADVAYTITSVWIIWKNGRDPMDAIHSWWDKIATFVPTADEQFGEEGAFDNTN